MLELMVIHIGAATALMEGSVSKLEDILETIGDPRFMELHKSFAGYIEHVVDVRADLGETPEGKEAMANIKQAMDDVRAGISLN